MFEQETEIIINTIIQCLTQNTTDAVAVKDILAADIPHPIKSFFRSDVEAMLLSEIRQYQKTSRFNFDHQEVRNLQEQINSHIVLNYSFTKLAFLQRLDEAVHIIINYLIRPQWTLTSIIFEKEQTISSQALTLLLRYFGPYEYLREIIIHYVKEKQILSFSKDEFKSFIWKVDGEYIRRKSGDELARVMIPIYDFFDFPNKTGNLYIPTKALTKFFEDKGLAMILPRLEGETIQGKTKMNRQELAMLLEDVRRTLGAFQVEKIEVDHDELVKKTIDDPFTKDQTPSEPKHDFESAINESDKRKFIKKIFQQDESVYGLTLRTLSGMSSWKLASKFIDETFIKHDVDPYSSEARRFIEVIFEQYHHNT